MMHQLIQCYCNNKIRLISHCLMHQLQRSFPNGSFRGICHKRDRPLHGSYIELSTGVFPSALCDAAVTPILKKPSLNKNDMKNCRPVSNIKFLGKVIEKVVSSQLKSYIDANGLAEPLQSACVQSLSWHRNGTFVCTELSINCDL